MSERSEAAHRIECGRIEAANQFRAAEDAASEIRPALKALERVMAGGAAASEDCVYIADRLFAHAAELQQRIRNAYHAQVKADVEARA